jgi:multimeric flavodoxin WrbA
MRNERRNITMSTVIAINGSPRKKRNTATLLEHALEGAKSQGADTELVHLYDLDFKGCTSCFACKLKEGKSYGRCAMKDDLTPILARIEHADGLILGSPIYLATITGAMKSFLERFTYPYVTYATLPPSSIFAGTMQIGFIYTFGVSDTTMKAMQYDWQIRVNQMLLDHMFGKTESLVVNDTSLFDDYSKYVTVHDVAAKKKQHRDVFPQDCKRAYDLGMRMARTVENPGRTC